VVLTAVLVEAVKQTQVVLVEKLEVTKIRRVTQDLAVTALITLPTLQ
jgi:hypothetical protein